MSPLVESLIRRGIFADADNAEAELERLRDDPVLNAVLADIETDMQELVLKAAPTDHEGRAAAVAEWRAARRVRDRLSDECGMARLMKGNEDD